MHCPATSGCYGSSMRKRSPATYARIFWLASSFSSASKQLSSMEFQEFSHAM